MTFADELRKKNAEAIAYFNSEAYKKDQERQREESRQHWRQEFNYEMKTRIIPEIKKKIEEQAKYGLLGRTDYALMDRIHGSYYYDRDEEANEMKSMAIKLLEPYGITVTAVTISPCTRYAVKIVYKIELNGLCTVC